MPFEPSAELFNKDLGSTRNQMSGKDKAKSHDNQNPEKKTTKTKIIRKEKKPPLPRARKGSAPMNDEEQVNDI